MAILLCVAGARTVIFSAAAWARRAGEVPRAYRHCATPWRICRG